MGPLIKAPPVGLVGDTLPAALPELPAFFSPCFRYRYWLAREIGGTAHGPALFILHNPSAADAIADDPTIRRCIGYARRWGCRRMIAVNRFAIRGTDPRVVFARATADPVGPLNDATIVRAAGLVGAASGIIVAAWGAFGANGVHRRTSRARRKAVIELLAGTKLYILGLTLDGDPCHPLYLKADARPQRWRPDATGPTPARSTHGRVRTSGDGRAGGQSGAGHGSRVGDRQGDGGSSGK
jgi:hypothetical protein